MERGPWKLKGFEKRKAPAPLRSWLGNTSFRAANRQGVRAFGFFTDTFWREMRPPPWRSEETLNDSRRAYRIKSAVRGVLNAENGTRLTELPAGAVLSLSSLVPNAKGMIEGTSGDKTVLVFLNDLEEKAELMNVRIPPASVRIVSALSQR